MKFVIVLCLASVAVATPTGWGSGAWGNGAWGNGAWGNGAWGNGAWGHGGVVGAVGHVGVAPVAVAPVPLPVHRSVLVSEPVGVVGVGGLGHGAGWGHHHG